MTAHKHFCNQGNEKTSKLSVAKNHRMGMENDCHVKNITEQRNTI